MQTVEIPDHGVAEFPDDMTPDQIKGVIQSKFYASPTPAATPQTGELPAPVIQSGVEAATAYGQQQGAPTLEEQKTLLAGVPEGVKAPLEAAAETAASLVPKSLEEAANLATMVSPIGPAVMEYKAVQAIREGRPLDALAGIPVAQRIGEIQAAEQTPAFSKERYKAGFGTLADILMIGGIGSQIRGGARPVPAGRTATTAPPLTETIFGKEQTPLVEEVNESLADLESRYGTLPDWATEEMGRRGLDPNRPLNHIDVQNPSVREAVLNDPTLTEPQKQNILKTGSPNAIQPSNAQVEAGQTAQRIEARPESEITGAGSSDYAIREAQGAAARGAIPGAKARQGIKEGTQAPEAAVAPQAEVAAPKFKDVNDEQLVELYHRYRGDYASRPTDKLSQTIDEIGLELGRRSGLPEGTIVGARGGMPVPAAEAATTAAPLPKTEEVSGITEPTPATTAAGTGEVSSADYAKHLPSVEFPYPEASGPQPFDSVEVTNVGSNTGAGAKTGNYRVTLRNGNNVVVQEEFGGRAQGKQAANRFAKEMQDRLEPPSVPSAIEPTTAKTSTQIPEGVKAKVQFRTPEGEPVIREMDAREAEGIFTKEKSSYEALIKCLTGA